MEQKSATTSLRAGLRKSILTSLVIGIAVIILISLFSDLRAVG
ncbi:MAG: UPF0104 family protein, partial [Chloroflexi bacterium]